MKRTIGMLVVILALALAGCGSTPTVQTPEGFAAFDSPHEPTALSPEGVGFRVRTVPNEPEQTLDFWTDALARQFTEAGYLLYKKGEFTAPAGDGVSFEWIAPVNENDWIYLTAFIVTDESIVIAEAAGPAAIYKEHRTSIHDALETITLGRGGPK